MHHSVTSQVILHVSKISISQLIVLTWIYGRCVRNIHLQRFGALWKCCIQFSLDSVQWLNPVLQRKDLQNLHTWSTTSLKKVGSSRDLKSINVLMYRILTFRRTWSRSLTWHWMRFRRQASTWRWQSWRRRARRCLMPCCSSRPRHTSPGKPLPNTVLVLIKLTKFAVALRFL